MSREENRIPTYSVKSSGPSFILQKVRITVIPLNFRAWDQTLLAVPPVEGLVLYTEVDFHIADPSRIVKFWWELLSFSMVSLSLSGGRLVMFPNGGTFINIILNVDFVSSHVLLVQFPDVIITACCHRKQLPFSLRLLWPLGLVYDLNRDQYWTVVFALTFIEIG